MTGERTAAECAVIGAGFSGLAAASELRAAGLDVLVLEARDRVGGRTLSRRLNDGTVVDLGGQWIGATHRRLARLGAAQGASTFRQHDKGVSVIRVAGRSIRSRRRVPLGLGPIALTDLVIGILRLDRRARRVAPAEPWAARRADAIDSGSVESWIHRNLRTERARAVLGSTLTGIFAAEPAEISMLHALAYIRAGEGIANLTGTTGAAQDSCFAGGMGSLAESVASNLGERIRLGQEVRAIDFGRQGATVETNALTVECEHVIVAIPPVLAGEIEYSPALPVARRELTERVPPGSAVKCIAVFDSPFWRAGGHSGLVLDCEGPVSMVIDGSAPERPTGVLIAFLEGDHARTAAELDAGSRRSIVLECLVRHFGADAGTPSDYLDQVWSAEPFTRGCYSAVFPPGVWTSCGAALREPAGPIHWAGTETATEWMGYIEGALQAGERAAGEVITARRGAS